MKNLLIVTVLFAVGSISMAGRVEVSKNVQKEYCAVQAKQLVEEIERYSYGPPVDGAVRVTSTKNEATQKGNFNENDLVTSHATGLTYSMTFQVTNDGDLCQLRKLTTGVDFNLLQK